MRWEPMKSWLPVQRWEYTEALAAEDMADLEPGSFLEQAAARLPLPSLPSLPSMPRVEGEVKLPLLGPVPAGEFASACGKGFLLAALAGWTVGKLGVVPAAAGVAAAVAAWRSLDERGAR